MAEFTKFSFLRGSSTKSDVSFAETSVPTDNGTYKTEVGEYVPAEVEIYTDSSVSDNFVDTSPVPCPDGTYLTADNTCMSLETDTFDFPDLVTAGPIDTGPVPCPEGTFLNAENQCMYLETEEYDFGDEVNTVEQIIDTSPVPCPEGTYLNAENQCMYLETEELDFAANPSIDTGIAADTITDINTATSFDFAVNPAVECPEGFTLTADNSCMYLGAELQTKF